MTPTRAVLPSIAAARRRAGSTRVSGITADFTLSMLPPPTSRPEHPHVPADRAHGLHLAPPQPLGAVERHRHLGDGGAGVDELDQELHHALEPGRLQDPVPVAGLQLLQQGRAVETEERAHREDPADAEQLLDEAVRAVAEDHADERGVADPAPVHVRAGEHDLEPLPAAHQHLPQRVHLRGVVALHRRHPVRLGEQRRQVAEAGREGATRSLVRLVAEHLHGQAARLLADPVAGAVGASVVDEDDAALHLAVQVAGQPRQVADEPGDVGRLVQDGHEDEEPHPWSSSEKPGFACRMRSSRCRNHSTWSCMPRVRSIAGRCPSRHSALVVSTRRWRGSPYPREKSVYGTNRRRGRLRAPASRQTRYARFTMLRWSAAPPLTTSPSPYGASSIRRVASTASETWAKGRVWVPSPWIGIGWSVRAL